MAGWQVQKEIHRPAGNPIFIVGLYKCGTTWLLSALSAHPQALGLREFDIIRAAAVGNADRIELAPPQERVKAFFARSSWCQADPDTALQVLKMPPEEGAALIRKASLKSGFHEDRRPGRPEVSAPQPDVSAPQPGVSASQPRAFCDLSAGSAAEMVRAVKEAEHPERLVRRFIELAATGGREVTHLVLKAADQIAVFDTLTTFFPEAPKIVIIRDGRDAAISALHYRELMRQKKAPWLKRSIDYEAHLKGWVSRAGMVRERLRHKELLVVRYEDLSSDFTRTFSALLSRLGLDHSPELVEGIRGLTSFRAMSGRGGGEEARSIFRKGITGEWLEYLDRKEKKRAWKTAGDILSFFGYGKDGKNRDFYPPA
jgi:hypothetical protein